MLLLLLVVVAMKMCNTQTHTHTYARTHAHTRRHTHTNMHTPPPVEHVAKHPLSLAMFAPGWSFECGYEEDQKSKSRYEDGKETEVYEDWKETDVYEGGKEMPSADSCTSNTDKELSMVHRLALTPKP